MPLTKPTFQTILKEHKKLLKNMYIKNDKKLVICFSAVPASGKTLLSKIIEKKYSAVRINKDKIGQIILSLNPTQSTTEKENLTDQYIHHLFNNYPFPNTLIILDKSIDREYPKLLNLLKEINFKRFIIRIYSNKQDIINTIKTRNKSNAKEWLVKVDKWFNDFQLSEKNLKSDIDIKNINDLNKLYKMLTDLFI